MFKYEEIVLERVSAGRAARCRPCGCPPHRQPPLTPKHSPELMGTVGGSAPLPGGVWGCLAFLPPQQGAGLSTPPAHPSRREGGGFLPHLPLSHPRPRSPASAELGLGGALCHRLRWKMEAEGAALTHAGGGFCLSPLARLPPPCPSGWLCLAAGH